MNFCGRAVKLNFRILFMVIATIYLSSCGDRSDAQRAPASLSSAAKPPGEAANGVSRNSRQFFILCPALENHRDELASLVGFKQDPKKALSMSASSRECVVRGADGSFIGVSMPPAFIKSVEQHATQSYDGTASPAPEVGNDAMFVDRISQPHLIFTVGPTMIDVYAEHDATPPKRATMVTLATRVRDILVDAN